jgi:hypothetical protein
VEGCLETVQNARPVTIEPPSDGAPAGCVDDTEQALRRVVFGGERAVPGEL